MGIAVRRMRMSVCDKKREKNLQVLKNIRTFVLSNDKHLRIWEYFRNTSPDMT